MPHAPYPIPHSHSWLDSPETVRTPGEEASLSVPAQTLFNATCVDFSTQKRNENETNELAP